MARPRDLPRTGGADGAATDNHHIRRRGSHRAPVKLFETSAVLHRARSHEELDMLRNLIGFAVFAVVALLLLKLVFGLFGLVLGLFGALLWLAFLGFVIYLILKLFAPETAARVREMIAGE
jgi:hypothetical protein